MMHRLKHAETKFEYGHAVLKFLQFILKSSTENFIFVVLIT